MFLLQVQVKKGAINTTYNEFKILFYFKHMTNFIWYHQVVNNIWKVVVVIVVVVVIAHNNHSICGRNRCSMLIVWISKIGICTRDRRVTYIPTFSTRKIPSRKNLIATCIVFYNCRHLWEFHYFIINNEDHSYMFTSIKTSVAMHMFMNL
jgi:hypothetical protein